MHGRAEIFSELRPVLMKLAMRILGSEAEAEDMVQEAFLRCEQTDTNELRSPQAFLTTVVTRLCLNHLKLARVRLEHDDSASLLGSLSSEIRTPAEQAELADALSEALTFALGELSPVERAVFLLREGFAFDYSDIASVVDRSEENCRQILRRTRERIASKEPTPPPAREQNQRVISEFLSAAETGHLEPLLKLLANDAVLAQGAPDLSKPAPPLIHDREVLLQTLRTALHDMRQSSDDFALFPIGQNYACVARSGGTARRAILLRLSAQKVSAVRLVSCPVLLRQLQILLAMNSADDCQQANTQLSN